MECRKKSLFQTQMQNLLEQLNPEQRVAAETTEGPVLILAGAGTGKTRAITYRMANLISKGMPAEAILAVTFTNKAAEEMQNRVTDLLLRAGVPPARPWISTFHSLCARFLRREATHAGLPKDFAIYDDDDQIAAVKLVMGRLQIEEDGLTPRNVLSRISYAKNQAQSPEQMRADAFGPDTRKVADIFAGYEGLLKNSKAVDFDDLLLRSARLLRESPEVRERWRTRFEYIHVDEYQDTNRVQYDLLRLLTNEQQNVCVVGDEDQSIYRWRGADVSILLSFSQDFPAAKVVRLERNYRSTQAILDAAAAVVSNNPDRLGKNLQAQKEKGRESSLLRSARCAGGGGIRGGRSWNGFWATIRIKPARWNTGRISNRGRLRKCFGGEGLRYKLVGGFSFYNRAEVKDALAYVRLALHPEDDISLLRVLNVPARGIGKTTVDALREIADRERLSLWDAIESLMTSPAPTRAIAPLRAFRELVVRLQRGLQHQGAGGISAVSCWKKPAICRCCETATRRKTWRGWKTWRNWRGRWRRARRPGNRLRIFWMRRRWSAMRIRSKTNRGSR